MDCIRKETMRESAPLNRVWKEWLNCTVWLTASLVSTYLIMNYDFKPGMLGPRQTHWPTDTTLVRSSERPTVVAFLHPRCVCTRATVKQLIRTLKFHEGADVIAALFVPLDIVDHRVWEEGEYVKTIRAEMPAAHVIFDRGGSEAKRFGAFTSGTILAYDREGKEIFRGGITDRRGGEKGNPGLERLASIVTGKASSFHTGRTPVFGCPLVLPNALEKNGGAQ